MTYALLEPSEDERAATTELRQHCQRLLKAPARRDSVQRDLELRQSDLDRLLRREDWTMSAALRIAAALGIGVSVKLEVP